MFEKSQDEVARTWQLVEKIGFCMLASFDGDKIRSRPMAAYVEGEEGAIYFLTDKDSDKEEEVAARHEVNLAFADAGAQTYVSVTGRASLSNDRDRIRQIWSPAAKAWWDGPEDPSIRLLKIEADDAQYWDSPGKVRSYVRMAAAAMTAARPAMGDNAKVELGEAH